MLSLGKQEIIISVVGIDRKGCPASSFNPTGSLRRKLPGSMCNEDPSIVGDGVGGGAEVENGPKLLTKRLWWGF